MDVANNTRASLVSTHSRPKAAGSCHRCAVFDAGVSTHSRPKAAGPKKPSARPTIRVSTHSRPKAAGKNPKTPKIPLRFQHTAARRRLGLPEALCSFLHSFNTQPPEGGWLEQKIWEIPLERFNTQPPEGGWLFAGYQVDFAVLVSTHSRPKAAGVIRRAAFWQVGFQHTAARRRLDFASSGCGKPSGVSTHSRPKAAGFTSIVFIPIFSCFNTQPPEGGWLSLTFDSNVDNLVSTHSRPKAAGLFPITEAPAFGVSTHSRPKAAGQKS